MAVSFEKLWKRWIEELKERAPLDKPVLVRRLKRPIIARSTSAKDPHRLESQLGYVYILEGRYVISISAIEAQQVQQATLLHEWAHCIAHAEQCKNGTRWLHDDIYGIAYAFTYRAFHEEPTP